MLVTLFGISILVKPVHPEKALLLILDNLEPSSKLILLIFLLFSNIFSFISSTNAGIIIF